MTASGKFQYNSMMDQSIHRRHRRHRILENLVPLGKRKIAADSYAPPLIARRQKREQHFHLLPGLLHVSKVIEDDYLVAIKLLQQIIEL